MDKTALLYSLFLLLGVFISAISQVLLKKSALKKHDSKIKEYLNPRVIIAYTLFIGTTFMSILAYRGIPLSMGPVLESTSYIYITIFGVKIFDEKINKGKILALLLIISGIAVSAFGQ